MPAIPTVGGVAYFWAGGRQLRVRGDFKVQPNNFQWEGVTGQDGVHGRKRVPVIPRVEANISDDGTLSLQDLVAMVDATVTVELDNGKSYIYQQAWYSGLAQLDTGEGQIGVKFKAPTAYEEPALCAKCAEAAQGQAHLFGIADTGRMWRSRSFTPSPQPWTAGGCAAACAVGRAAWTLAAHD
jgi:hypothetical protein